MGLELVHLNILLIAGLSLWLTLAIINNILDFATNRHLLSEVTSMRELKHDNLLGKGLVARAIGSETYPAWLLRVVIATQIIAACLLWRGLAYLLGAETLTAAVPAVNLGLAAFLAIWLWFLIGGLYHGYWIKMPQVQQVHLALVIISIGAMILVNLPVQG